MLVGVWGWDESRWSWMFDFGGDFFVTDRFYL